MGQETAPRTLEGIGLFKVPDVYVACPRCLRMLGAGDGWSEVEVAASPLDAATVAERIEAGDMDDDEERSSEDVVTLRYVFGLTVCEQCVVDFAEMVARRVPGLVKEWMEAAMLPPKH